MILTDCSAPTTAERIRSTCIRAGGALLAVERAEPFTTPLHHLLRNGSFAVAVPVSGAAAQRRCAPLAAGGGVGQSDPAAHMVNCGTQGTQAVLELADYAPLPLREPVRSLVWIRGRLQHVPLPTVHKVLDQIAAERPHPALLQVQTAESGPILRGDVRYRLLRLEIESVVVTDASGAEAVEVPALLAARPDPFCMVESCWIRHLDAAHQDVVARLASQLPARLRRGDVRPLGLDRYGVRLRVESTDGDCDVRLPFPKPVDDATDLNRAIRVLMGCPFVNGLRARQS